MSRGQSGFKKIVCRSDNERGRWEYLKPKPAQMVSDACSVNRHQPTAVCRGASDLWQLHRYENSCLTSFGCSKSGATHGFQALLCSRCLKYYYALTLAGIIHQREPTASERFDFSPLQAGRPGGMKRLAAWDDSSPLMSLTAINSTQGSRVRHFPPTHCTPARGRLPLLSHSPSRKPGA